MSHVRYTNNICRRIEDHSGYVEILLVPFQVTEKFPRKTLKSRLEVDSPWDLNPPVNLILHTGELMYAKSKAIDKHYERVYSEKITREKKSRNHWNDNSSLRHCAFKYTQRNLTSNLKYIPENQKEKSCHDRSTHGSKFAVSASNDHVLSNIESRETTNHDSS